MKITHLRARRLKITISFYSPARGSRPVYRARKGSRSRTRRVGSGYLVSGRAPSYHFGLAIFGNLEVFFVSLSLLSLCFVILTKYSRAQKGAQASYSYHHSFSVALELNSYLE